MVRILSKIDVSSAVTRIILDAPLVAAKAQAGQFVALIVDEQGERIPLTLADWDAAAGTVTLIFQKVGYTTKKLAALNAGDSVAHLLGPLGHPTPMGHHGTVVCVGGGVGIAEVYPVSRAFAAAGNRVIGILGARSKELLMLEDEMKGVCAELFTVTDDGSYGRKGLVTDVLKELFGVIEKSTHTKYPDLVYAIGPVRMMKAVAELTRPNAIKTLVSVNPIMVDATGMCGACRCTVEGKTKFGCVDGPDFDAHQLDFESLEKRLSFFKQQEQSL